VSFSAAIEGSAAASMVERRRVRRIMARFNNAVRGLSIAVFGGPEFGRVTRPLLPVITAKTRITRMRRN
jgi:hypothetical protein